MARATSDWSVPWRRLGEAWRVVSDDALARGYLRPRFALLLSSCRRVRVDQRPSLRQRVHLYGGLGWGAANQWSSGSHATGGWPWSPS